MNENDDRRELTVSEQDVGVRLDLFLCERIAELSRNAAVRLIENGNVEVCGQLGVKNRRLKTGDTVAVTMPQPASLGTQAQDIPLVVVYEDSDLLVIDKPRGMVVHPAVGNRDGTLVNALLAHCGDSLSGINGVLRPGIVHRIDKNTSGLLVVAKNDMAHRSLAEQIARHDMNRVYEAIVHGNIKQNSGTIDAPIGRSLRDRKKYCVTDRNSKSAVTHFEVIERYGSYTRLKLRLETGRTHQIRVHMAHIGHPVAGDTVYGPRTTPKSLGGQCLHARTLGFIHPVSGEYLEFDSAPPEYFENFASTLSKGANNG
ncbi:MAG: RluA family pseudouridine synthase [Oscillospiraceae bacterium]